MPPLPAGLAEIALVSCQHGKEDFGLGAEGGAACEDFRELKNGRGGGSGLGKAVVWVGGWSFVVLMQGEGEGDYGMRVMGFGKGFCEIRGNGAWEMGDGRWKMKEDGRWKLEDGILKMDY